MTRAIDLHKNKMECIGVWFSGAIR